MMIIPAVDIKGGKCVRLLQGRMDAETVFSNEPEKMAKQWESQGAELIHVVDLDGAIQKHPVNIESIKRIINTVDTPIQVGGGIRDLRTIHQYMDLGVNRVVIGTEAIRNPKLVQDACRFYPNKIVVAIDARNGFVAVEGWTETTNILAIDLAKRLEDYGICAINFTDIHRDGMQTGPNIAETQKLAESVQIPVVASGGVSTLDHIRALSNLPPPGVWGVIIGRALYAGAFRLYDAISVAKSSKSPTSIF